MSWSEQALALARKLSCSIDNNIYLPFIVNGLQCGIVQRDFLSLFKERLQLFDVSENHVKLIETNSTEKRSELLNQFFRDLRDEESVSTLKGWRNETYSVFKDHFQSELLFDLERTACPIIGCKSYGVHMNGFVRKGGEILMWVGKRSPTKSRCPGLYDNTVAGGISSGYGVWETLCKEGEEEASIPLHIMSRAVPVGMLCYTIVNQYGTSPEVMFVYDLELPAEFIPKNADGEVAGFELMSLSDLKELIVTDKFKPNCAGVVLDFLIRHGYIAPDDTPHYVEILNLLRTPHPF